MKRQSLPAPLYLLPAAGLLLGVALATAARADLEDATLS
jgi:hypothetical protein